MAFLFSSGAEKSLNSQFPELTYCSAPYILSAVIWLLKPGQPPEASGLIEVTPLPGDFNPRRMRLAA